MELLSLLKALADENRLRLVAILDRGEFTVQELTAILGTGQSLVSHHLKTLAEAGIVSVKRQGTWAYYRLETASGLFGEVRPILESRFDELAGRREDLSRMARILEERQRKSREFFDRHARRWDAMAGTILPTADCRAALLDAIPHCTMLVEIGVGTGALLPELCRRAERVIGVDHSPAMIELARQRVLEMGLGNVELRLGELSHLPLADAQAGAVVLNMVLHHAPHPSGVFFEIRRVLGTLGVLMIADFARHDKEWVRDELADLWLGFDRQELEDWLESAGFRLESFDPVPGRGTEQDVFILKAICQDVLTNSLKG